jgi:catechol 2,3-dioxygenase-like lactoylglutathione lyase family enzyme
MALKGIASIVIAVDDLTASTTFLQDFGLIATAQTDRRVVFTLPEGSSVQVVTPDYSGLPAPFGDDRGVREVVWGVETRSELEAIERDLRGDRAVARDEDGTLHFLDDQASAVGLSTYRRTPPQPRRDVTNTPGWGERRNGQRAWYDRAQPKLIHHAVFGVPDFAAGMRFYVDRLGFHVSDVSRDRGIFGRCAGQAQLPTPQDVRELLERGA